MQLLAALASILTAYTLIRRKDLTTGGTSHQKKAAGALKVLLTNIPGMVYALVFGTPLVFDIEVADGQNSASEMKGWMGFYSIWFVSLGSSIWNPIVFLLLTPKSRDLLVSVIKRRNAVDQQVTVTEN